MAASTDPSIIAFEDLLTEYVGKVSSITAKIGGQVQDIINVLGEAFSVQKDLLIKIKQTKVKRFRTKSSYDAKKLTKMLNDSSLYFKYSSAEKATANWDESNKLGQGGFGTVYKGVLSDGREIAVKRLFFNNKFRAADFYNEVNMISCVEHKNLVRLLGDQSHISTAIAGTLG
ncbi:hypothetical protein L2E82_09146 [Cichorium intybus]|uniref:Uncharacterized protein n=1 Tax=Cichorium intybus TaxID=13427 RepID=A0ACB9G892_CICIN|nr:hypothetical protein L2E82_09146 [Cichorium intybus]